MSQHFISVEALKRQFPGTDQAVFEDLWFGVDKGEFVCIIGHSGCGKTTVLNILAGLDQPSEGAIIFDGKAVEGPSLDRAVVFQGHALMPWMNVLDNVLFAVQSRWPSWPKAMAIEQAKKYIAMVNLGGAEHKKPAQLSGGMK